MKEKKQSIKQEIMFLDPTDFKIFECLQSACMAMIKVGRKQVAEIMFDINTW